MPGIIAAISGRAAGRAVAAMLLVVWLQVLASPAGASVTLAPSGTPIVSVTRHGGLCVTGRECRSTLRIDDTTISGDGYAPRRLQVSERVALLRAIDKLDAKYLRTHPFAGTCPTAYDGSESIYRFRGFPKALASCTSDLRSIAAVRLTERLLATLKPKGR